MGTFGFAYFQECIFKTVKVDKEEPPRIDTSDVQGGRSAAASKRASEQGLAAGVVVAGEVVADAKDRLLLKFLDNAFPWPWPLFVAHKW